MTNYRRHVIYIQLIVSQQSLFKQQSFLLWPIYVKENITCGDAYEKRSIEGTFLFVDKQPELNWPSSHHTVYRLELYAGNDREYSYFGIDAFNFAYIAIFIHVIRLIKSVR